MTRFHPHPCRTSQIANTLAQADRNPTHQKCPSLLQQGNALLNDKDSTAEYAGLLLECLVSEPGTLKHGQVDYIPCHASNGTVYYFQGKDVDELDSAVDHYVNLNVQVINEDETAARVGRAVSARLNTKPQSMRTNDDDVEPDTLPHHVYIHPHLGRLLTDKAGTKVSLIDAASYDGQRWKDATSLPTYSCGSCCFGAITAPVGLDSFYKKQLVVHGLKVVSSNAVSDTALYQAALTIARLSVKRPDFLDDLVKENVLLAVMGKNEVTTDIPDHSTLPNSPWNSYRGLGPTQWMPTMR